MVVTTASPDLSLNVSERPLMRLLWLANERPPQDTAQAAGAAGWQLLHLDKGARTAAWVKRLAPEVVVMQWVRVDLPWLRETRAATPAPLLVLTAAREESEQAQLFDAGADAVLHAAASSRLVLARLLALRRLRPAAQTAPVHVGALQVPPLTQGARFGQQALDLSPTEQALLHELVRSQGRAVSRTALGACLAPRNQARHARTLDVLISRLRQRLRAQSVHDVQIRAVPGVGYCLTTAAA
jgi:DNA-binding response OmpR family regulator